MSKRHEINPTLFDVAAWRLQGEQEKQAFVPQGATDPAMGGAPPGDPMAGGMPPPPGGDPMAAMGGAPPMPPPMPAGPPMDPMAAAGGAPPAAPGAPGAGGKPKIDPTFIYQELSRVRKLLTHMMKSTGIDMPNDILDDGAVGMIANGQVPQSAPLGQGGESEMGGAPGGDPGGAGLPALGGAPPVGPMEAPGAGGPGGGTEKPASDVMSLFSGPSPNDRPDFNSSENKLNALAALSRSLGQDA